jgi:hypothetical protein
MTKIVDTFFGGAEKKAGKAVANAARDAQKIIRENTAQARSDISTLFPSAAENVTQGFQGALDVFGQALPAQTQAFQQGNIAAQQQLLAGLPQFQNAILGGQVDYSQLQPTQLQTPDLSFFQQQLPQFQVGFAQPGAQPMQPTFQPSQSQRLNFADLLSGNRLR